MLSVDDARSQDQADPAAKKRILLTHNFRKSGSGIFESVPRTNLYLQLNTNCRRSRGTRRSNCGKAKSPKLEQREEGRQARHGTRAGWLAALPSSLSSHEAVKVDRAEPAFFALTLDSTSSLSIPSSLFFSSSLRLHVHHPYLLFDVTFVVSSLSLLSFSTT